MQKLRAFGMLSRRLFPIGSKWKVWSIIGLHYHNIMSLHAVNPVGPVPCAKFSHCVPVASAGFAAMSAASIVPLEPGG